LHGSGLPPFLLLLTAVELSWSLTDDEQRLIVAMHNHYRSQVSPRAADMLKMSWDPDLEAFAKAYAAKCIWGHNKERGRRGENLFAITDEMDVEVALDQWYNEHEHYNLTTSKCSVGQMCGHYTQVVWANSERIGCGMQFCKTLHGVEEPDLYLLVCNYDPPGNVRGRKPYKEGPPCSMCPEGYTCRNSILSPLDGPENWGRGRFHPWDNPPESSGLVVTHSPLCLSSEPSVDSEEASPSSRTTRPNLTTRPALATATTTTSPTTITTIRPAPTTVKKRLTPTTTRPAPTTTSPTTTTTLGPAPTTTTATTRPPPTTTTTTSPPPTRTARPNPTTATGPTSSLEPTSDLNLKTSPEMQVDSEETGAPLVTTEAVLFLDLESTFSPTASPEMERDLKESDAVSVRAEPALSSEPPPSFSLTTPETDLSLEDTKQPPPALKPAPATAKVTSLLHLLPPSKAAAGHSLAVQSFLSGKAAVE
uniref:Peptidase inhibitor 16 n=1 Tax=Terrapene triunguis TaxID=2587831 RepID=A0A674J2V1_9SAUR